MSELHTDTTTAANGALPPRTKRRVASTSIEGSTVTIKFLQSDREVSIDTSKLPVGVQPNVQAYGVGAILQGAYGNAEEGAEADACEAMAKRLMSGDWRPGLQRASAEPDALLVALADHLDKDVDYIEGTYLQAYAYRHGLTSQAAARRKLRAHPEIAAKVASITAERAKRAAEAAKKAPREALDL